MICAMMINVSLRKQTESPIHQVTGIIEFHDAVTPENTASQTRDEAFRSVPLEATTGDLHSMRSVE